MCKISSFTPTFHFLKLSFTHNFTLVFKVRLKRLKLLSQLYVWLKFLESQIYSKSYTWHKVGQSQIYAPLSGIKVQVYLMSNS